MKLFQGPSLEGHCCTGGGQESADIQGVTEVWCGGIVDCHGLKIREYPTDVI